MLGDSIFDCGCTACPASEDLSACVDGAALPAMVSDDRLSQGYLISDGGEVLSSKLSLPMIPPSCRQSLDDSRFACEGLCGPSPAVMERSGVLREPLIDTGEVGDGVGPSARPAFAC